MSRWTDGDAVLPLPPMRGPIMLEIQFAGAMTFLEDAVAVDGIERRRLPSICHHRDPGCLARGESPCEIDC
jgi:hypothetical protein